MSDPRTEDWTADATRGWRMESPEERRRRLFDAALAGDVATLNEMQDGEDTQAIGSGNARVGDARGSGGRPAADTEPATEAPTAAAYAGADEPSASGHPLPERIDVGPLGNNAAVGPRAIYAAPGAALPGRRA